MKQMSWRAVADALAERMENHAYCDTHPDPGANADKCPFCADRAAYRMWQAKSGKQAPGGAR